MLIAVDASPCTVNTNIEVHIMAYRNFHTIVCAFWNR